MRISIVAVGRNMPGWVEQGFAEYRKRLRTAFQLELREIPLARRSQDPAAQQRRAREARAIFPPSSDTSAATPTIAKSPWRRANST